MTTAQMVVALLPEECWGRMQDESWRHLCSMGRCEVPALYRCSYRYITGRGGRVAVARKYACSEHARRFAEKHGLRIDCSEESTTCEDA